MNFFNNIKLRTKFLIFMIVPLLSIVLLSLVVITEHFHTLKQTNLLVKGVDLSSKISLVIHDLQKERGTSLGFIGASGKTFDQQLIVVRANSDESIKSIYAFLQYFDKQNYSIAFNNKLDGAINGIEQIPQMRARVDKLDAGIDDILNFYTSVIDNLISCIAEIANLSDQNAITRNLINYITLVKAKEAAGLERALISNTFSADKFSPSIYERFISLISAQNTLFSEFKLYATDNDINFLYRILNSASSNEVEKLRNIAIQKHDEGNFGVDSKYWFETISIKIEELKDLEDKLAEDLINQILKIQNHSTFIFWTFLILFIVIVLMVVSAWFVLGNNIGKRVNKLLNFLITLEDNKEVHNISVDTSHGRDEIDLISNAVYNFVIAVQDLLKNFNTLTDANDTNLNQKTIDHIKNYKTTINTIKQEYEAKDLLDKISGNDKQKKLIMNSISNINTQINKLIDLASDIIEIASKSNNTPENESEIKTNFNFNNPNSLVSITVNNQHILQEHLGTMNLSVSKIYNFIKTYLEKNVDINIGNINQELDTMISSLADIEDIALKNIENTAILKDQSITIMQNNDTVIKLLKDLSKQLKSISEIAYDLDEKTIDMKRNLKDLD